MTGRKNRRAKAKGESKIVTAEELNKRGTYPELQETNRGGKIKEKTFKYTWIDKKGKKHREELRLVHEDERKSLVERAIYLDVPKESRKKPHIDVIVPDWREQPSVIRRVLQTLGEDEVIVNLSEGSPMPLSEFGWSPAEFGKDLGIPIDENFRGNANVESIEHVVGKILSFGAWESTIIGKKVKVFLYSEIEGFMLYAIDNSVRNLEKIFDKIKVVVMEKERKGR